MPAGEFVVLDIADAQQALHRYGKLDRIDVTVGPQRRFRAVEKAIRSALPLSASAWKSPGARSEENQRMLRAFRWNLRVLSYISLVVGAFLIYNTISVSVVRRRAEIGILRAIGRGALRDPRDYSWARRCSSASPAPRSAWCWDACWPAARCA